MTMTQREDSGMEQRKLAEMTVGDIMEKKVNRPTSRQVFAGSNMRMAFVPLLFFMQQMYVCVAQECPEDRLHFWIQPSATGQRPCAD